MPPILYGLIGSSKFMNAPFAKAPRTGKPESPIFSPNTKRQFAHDRAGVSG